MSSKNENLKSKEKTGLYVITHKEVKNIYPKDRKIMMVGAIDKTVPEGYYSDYDEKLDNISAKNKNFCELTGLYYFVKHDKSEILSLEHYRRLFVKTKYFLFRYPFLKEKDIKKILKEYDIIMPKKVDLHCPILERYARGHVGSDMLEVKNIIAEKYPDYIDAFNVVMSDTKTYLCNMFIAKRDVICKYCDWLFDILFELEKRIDISDRDDYQKRVFGFLSERLFTVYLEKHKEIKVCEKRIHMVESNAFNCQMNKLKQKIKNVFVKNKN